ncbi:NB-ARC domain-containing protein [Rossellomorea sp. GAMAL-10_SWC]
MKELNLNTRILMFAVCTSLEFDLRKFIVEGSNHLELHQDLVSKAVGRNKLLVGPYDSNNYNLLVELDMGDLISILYSNAFEFKLGVERRDLLKSYFDKIIPIRNRVMHTRPLEIGDRSVLTEVAQRIGVELPFIEWSQLNKTHDIILTRPHEIYLRSSINKYERDTHVYHNLPIPEFDDTGFIGRKNELKDILNLLKDGKNQIISIVGNGGLGKTATAVKVLFELIDAHDNPFEAILWISLKTRTLSQGEFSNIKNAIKDLSDVYDTLESLVVKENESAVSNILNFMENFKTLLVLDNLETLNTTDIVEFLKSIPENSKVLITSRHGIRELENRYTLNGLDAQDSLTYFRLLSNYYNLDVHKRPENELKTLIKDYLYQSPLSIKWFLSSIAKGIDEKSILANKESLIEFCMSNVVEKLSEEEKKILKLFLVEGKNLSYGEIDFFISMEEAPLMLGLNNLISTSLLAITKGEYSMNQMAKDFLSKSNPPTNEFIKEIAEKRKKLNALMQEIKVKNEVDPFNPKSLYRNLDNPNSRIASFHLMKALEYSANDNWDESFKSLDKALSIAPDYFEVYKIKAFISAENENWYNAIENYRIAVEMCKNNKEKASVLYLFSYFYTVKMPDYEEAKNLIIEADKLNPGNLVIRMQKARILTYLGEYPEAENTFKDIDFKDISSDKHKNQYISWFAEVYRRMGEPIDYRDSTLKVSLYKKGIEQIELLDNIDHKTARVFSKILSDLSFIHHYQEAIECLEESVRKHYDLLIDTSQYIGDFSVIYNNLSKNPHNVKAELLDMIKKISIKYKQYARAINVPNEGMIIKKQGGFGFIDNGYGSHYFNVSSIKYDSPAVGDTVKFTVLENPKGKVAIEVDLIKRFDI